MHFRHSFPQDSSSVESGVEDGEAALEDGAVPEVLDVACVDGVAELVDLGAGPVAGDALPVLSSELLGTGSDTCPIVLEQVLWTLLDTGGAVSSVEGGVEDGEAALEDSAVPEVLDVAGVDGVAEPGLAHAVIVEVLASQAVR